MRKLLIVSFLVFLMPALLFGQEQYRSNTSQGYLFAAPGNIGGTTTLEFGGGGETDLYKGLGFGIDFGYLTFPKYLSAGVGVLSPNGRFAFRLSENSRLVPYVTGGYSLFFRRGVANAFNYGGGMDYWFTEKYGLKVEFRNHVLTNCSGNCNAYQVRMGVSFR